MSRGILVAYDDAGNVVATLDGLFEGTVAVDMAAREAEGAKLRSYWQVSGAVGSGSWPVNLGAAALDYRVELDAGAPHRIVALVHRDTGERVDRATAEAAADRGRSGRPVRISPL